MYNYFQQLQLHNATCILVWQVATVFLQVATRFADLHDTPGRMLSKGVIRQIVPLKSSRRFFYGR